MSPDGKLHVMDAFGATNKVTCCGIKITPGEKEGWLAVTWEKVTCDKCLEICARHNIYAQQVLRERINAKKYPHKCPKCGKPAYVGAVPAALDCLAGCK